MLGVALWRSSVPQLVLMCDRQTQATACDKPRAVQHGVNVFMGCTQARFYARAPGARAQGGKFSGAAY